MGTIYKISPDNGTTEYEIRDNNIAPIQLNATAIKKYEIEDQFILDSDGKTYRATATINNGGTITVGTNCVEAGTVSQQLKAQKQFLEDTVGWVGNNLINGTVDGYLINQNGVITASETFRYSTDSSVKPFNYYKFTCKHNTNDGSNYRIHGYDASGNWVKQIKVLFVNVAGNYEIPFYIDDATIKTVKVSMTKTATNYAITHFSVDECKTDNTVIAPVENNSTVSQAYAVGSHAIRDGAFIEWNVAKAQGENISSSDYSSKNIASFFNVNNVTITAYNSHVSNMGTPVGKRIGHIVQFNVAFDLDADVAEATALIEFDIRPMMFQLFPFYNRSTFALLDKTFYINESNGFLIPRQALSAGSYRAFGTIYCY